MERIKQRSFVWAAVWVVVITNAPLAHSFLIGNTHTSTRTYPWFKETIGAEQYLTGFDLDVCNASADTSTVLNGCVHPMPFQCGCGSGCETYGHCCHDRVSDLTAASPSTGCLQSGSYAMVKCPLTWGHDSVREGCEAGRGRYTEDEPVSDLSTQTTFRNELCARCHGVPSFVGWALRVTCKHFQDMYSVLTHDAFMQLVTSNSRICHVDNVPPHGILRPTPCPHSWWFSLPFVATCNVSGEWKDEAFDQDIVDNCALYKGFSLRVIDIYIRKVYQNLFCAICNGRLLNTHLCNSIGGIGHTTPGYGQAPMSLLFGLEDRELEQDDVRCVEGQWMDTQGECRNLTCTAGKLLQNGTCMTAVSQIRGLVYSLRMSLAPSSPFLISIHSYLPDLTAQLARVVGNKLENLTRSYSLQVSVDVEHVSNVTLDPVSFVKGQPVSDVTVKSVPDVIGEPVSDVTSSDGNVNRIRVRHVRVVGSITAPRNKDRDDAELSIVHTLFRADWNVSVNKDNVSLTRQLPVANATMSPTRESHEKNIYYDEHEDVEFDPVFSTDKMVKMSPVLTCPYVELQPGEFELRRDNDDDDDDDDSDVRVVLTSQGVEMEELLTLEGAWQDEDRGVLCVCSDTLKSLRRLSGPPWGGSGAPSWQYVLTMTLMPLSMLGLLLTLLVHALLAPLRTAPGLNTMGTCVALFVAQLCLLLASHRAAPRGPGCQALGALLHAAWLSAFCWTALCSLHMFRAFSAGTFHRSASGLARRMAANVAVTVLLPAGAVAAVVTASLLTSDGTRTGYSDVTCYLDGVLLVGVAMVMPVGALLVFNLTLFVLTVRRIHLVSKLNPHSEDGRERQSHVYVCARLSLLTGATWILALVAEGLGVDWLQFFSIVANGGQGVLLFLSYVTTRRVRVLLAARLGCGQRDKAASSSHTDSTQAYSASSKAYSVSSKLALTPIPTAKSDGPTAGNSSKEG